MASKRSIVVLVGVAVAAAVAWSGRPSTLSGETERPEVAPERQATAAARTEPAADAGLSIAAPCDGPDADPWVADRRDRLMAYNGLAHFAVERWGEPISCEGEVTSEFDGARYGTLRLTFPGGVVLDAETMPIETSVTMLEKSGGFDDEAGMLELLSRETADIGLSIDWDAAPEVSTETGREVRRYWDPLPGLNASGVLVYDGTTLIAIGVSMAL